MGQWLPEKAVELISTKSGSPQDAREGSSLDRPIPMDRNRDRIGNGRMPQNVVAAADPLDIPALFFESGDDLLAADRRKLGAHAAWTATLLRWTVGIGRPSSCITSR